MEKLWNDFSLKKPPFLTLPAKYSSFVQEMHAAIDTFFSKCVKDEQDFNETAALLSRLMARRKNSFNKMKGFKEVCKLNAALCRLLRLDFMRDLDSFRNTLPDVDYDNDTSIQLPTRDSFDFLLLRVIAIYELYKRIVDCCAAAAEYFAGQIHSYFFFEINTLLLAVLAKIHSMCRNKLNFVADLYNNTFPYRVCLPVNKRSNFLKETQFEFPNQLEIIKLNSAVSESVTAKNQPLRDLIKQEEKLPVIKAKKLKKTDTGKQIERISKPLQNTFDIGKLTTVEDIKNFITKESHSRSKNLKISVTSKIQNHEWAGATKLFERKMQSGETKKGINIFRKFLTSKMM